MAQLSLQIRDAVKSYGAQTVLNGVSLDAEDGAFIVLLGPSGCGKSTLLHAIAGLHPIDGGDILIDGRSVATAPARDRNIAMVFQSYALYPNMSVARNIGFPLRMRKMRAAEIERRVAEVARMLQIEPLLSRRPKALSGGQRQRVAIGRALVRDPRVFLFDEPLSNLDAILRVEMRSEIKRLHARLGKTMVYVTHDQIEAMTLATKIVVMRAGEIQQVGAPHDVYHRPGNLFVARFVGSPAMGLLAGSVRRGQDGAMIFDDGAGRVLPLSEAGPIPDFSGGPRDALLGLRPEHIAIADDGAGLAAVVESVEPTGPEDNVGLSVFDQRLVARLPTGAVRAGDAVTVRLELDKASVFDAVNGQRMN